MTNPTGAGSGIDAALAAMRKRYQETSRGFIATFDLIGQQLSVAPESDDLLTSLRRELHRVHGTAGSLGFTEAGQIAGAMEDVVRRWAEDDKLDLDRRSAIVLNFTRALGTAIHSADSLEPDARHIVLIELPDAVASGLVAEGVQRGFAVERLKAEAIGVAPRNVAPWGVIAMETDAALVASAGFTTVAHVLLRDAQSAGTRRSLGGRVIDWTSSGADILDLLSVQHSRQGGTGGTVLVVDDDPMMQLLLRTLAEAEGFAVEVAVSGEEFLSATKRIDPTLVVLDYELADSNGVELLTALRSDRRHRDVPVLMLSGRSDATARSLAFEAGADDYMVKPLVGPEFQHRILQLMAVRQDRRMATGLHPTLGLPLQARTMQELEKRLAERGTTHWSVAVLRPPRAADTAQEIDGWLAECSRIAATVHDAAGLAGLTSDNELLVAVPLSPQRAESLLQTLAGNDLENRWHAGVIGTANVASPTPRVLLAAADDAYIAARDAGVPVRVWDASDADIAPDVIIIEDDEALASLLAFALTARGLSHRVYHSGPEGLAALMRLKVHDRPRIVFLDVDLPGMDGHSLHERIRLERPGNFHVVFISLHTREADQLRAIQGGALDYITKPVSVRVLMAKLAGWRERAKGE